MNEIPEPIEFSSIRISEWNQFFSCIPQFQCGEWVFRGQEDADWGLATGLDRDRIVLSKDEDVVHPANASSHNVEFVDKFDFWTYERVSPKDHQQERNAIASFISYERTYNLSKHPYIDALVAMQHYGSKTRLLDFTWSMLVALFFAFEKQSNSKRRALFAVNFNSVFSKSKSIAAFKDRSVSKGTPENIAHYEKTAQTELFGDRKRMMDSLFEIAETNITGEENEIRDVFPVIAEGNNPRINAQNGLFLMSAGFDLFETNLAATLGTNSASLAALPVINGSDSNSVINAIRTGKFIKFVFDEDLERDAWNILDHANINPRTIYPDRIGLAKSVRYES